MTKKKGLKKTVVEVPKDLAEAAAFIHNIGATTRQIDEINTGLNEKIESLKHEAMKKVAPLSKQQDDLLEGLHTFAESRREDLTEGGKKKTVDLPTGSMSWRFTPPAVSLKDVEKVKKEIAKLTLVRFLRTKVEVDKEALLREPEVAKKIKGITISQKEEFVVKPSETDAEIRITVK